MKKNIIKTITVAAIAAFMFTGCAENRENNFNDSISNVVEESTASTTSEVEESTTSTTSSTTTSTVESKPVESSTTSTTTTSSTEKPIEKPVESKSTASSTTTSTTTSKPVEKPASSTTTTVSKPVEKPVESKPASSTTTSTTSKPVEKPVHTHTYSNGTCTGCGKNDPNYVAPHNCKTDGHVWKELTPKTSTETVEIVETHDVVANGYDITLAHRYFGRTSDGLDFTPYFGTSAYSAGSTKVKTIGTKTITEYIHKCTECGSEEVYNTEKTVTPGDTWEFVYPEKRGFFTTVWYDINNIPDEVYEAAEKDNKEHEDFWDTF